MRIRFVGGPYDGHQQTVTDNELPSAVALPVSANMFRLLNGEVISGAKLADMTSIAKYNRNHDKYIFERSFTP